jgi:hypothetical protein
MRLAADENFNNNIVRGVLRRQTEADISGFRMLVYPGQLTRGCWLGQPRKADYC